MFWRRTNEAVAARHAAAADAGLGGLLYCQPDFLAKRHLEGMAVGIADGSHIPAGRTSVSRAVEEPPFPTSQRAQPIHFLPTLAGHTKVGGSDERMIDLAPLGEDDDEGARVITHPRHIKPRRGHRTTGYHLHPCVRRVERDACVEIAHQQCHMGKAAIDHHSPPLDCCIHCCSRWCTSMAKRYPGCRDPLRCTARTAASLMIRTTLAPKLGEMDHSLPRTETCFDVFLSLSHVQGQGLAASTFERVRFSRSHPWRLREDASGLASRRALTVLSS